VIGLTVIIAVDYSSRSLTASPKDERPVASPISSPQDEVHVVVDVDRVICAVGDVNERVHRS
jgi:hypothetical protein